MICDTVNIDSELEVALDTISEKSHNETRYNKSDKCSKNESSDQKTSEIQNEQEDDDDFVEEERALEINEDAFEEVEEEEENSPEERKPEKQKPKSHTRIKRKPNGNPAHKGNRLQQYNIVDKLAIVEEAKLIGNRPAARKHKIDEKCIRAWRNQEASLKSHNQSGRTRLPGSGRKRQNSKLDAKLKEFTNDLIEKRQDITADLLMRETEKLWAEFNPQNPNPTKPQVYGTVMRFVYRNEIHLKKKEPKKKVNIPKRDLDASSNREIENFITDVRAARKANDFSKCHIVSVSECALWIEGDWDNVASEGDPIGTLNSKPKYGRTRFTVMLSAKADGTKLMPFVVFKSNQQFIDLDRFTNLVIGYSKNGLLNEELTLHYLDSVIGQYNRRLLIWDSNRNHVLPSVRSKLTDMKICTIEVPQTISHTIQHAEKCWNKCFKNQYNELYMNWRLTNKRIQDGIVVRPPLECVINWICEAWSRVSDRAIRDSFLHCGISNKRDGSQDGMIRCLNGDGEKKQKLTNMFEMQNSTQNDTQNTLQNPELIVAKKTYSAQVNHVEPNPIGQNHISKGDHVVPNHFVPDKFQLPPMNYHPEMINICTEPYFYPND